MNFRNYTMSELSDFLCNEPNRDLFIEAAKELTTRVVEREYVVMRQAELDKIIEDTRDEAIEDGRLEMRQECRNEMVEYIETRTGQHLDGRPLQDLLNFARVLC